jgi:hypothetical protein
MRSKSVNVFDEEAQSSTLYLVLDLREDAEKMLEPAFGFIVGQDHQGRVPLVPTLRGRRELSPEALAWCERNVLLAHRPARVFVHLRAHEGGGPLPDDYTGGGIGCPLRSRPPRAILEELAERGYAFGRYEMVRVLSVRLVARTCTERSTVL